MWVIRIHCYCTLLLQEDVEDLEYAVIDTIVTTVMKLSEATFRPMFYKVCHLMNTESVVMETS